MIIGASSKSAMIDLIPILWNLNIILESLPISSSGHLKLLTELFAHTKEPLRIESSTEHLMHIPNGLIILIFLMPKRSIYLQDFATLISFCLALMLTNALTGSAYLSFKKSFEKVPLALGFLCSGLVLLSLFFAPLTHGSTITLSHAFFIGLAQTLSLMPGVSRMTLTTVTGIWLGIDPSLSFIYSLACELTLIVIAVIVALQKKKSKHRLSQLNTITPLQLLILMISSIISYGALCLSYRGFCNQSVKFVGLYLIGISIFTALFMQRRT